MGNQPSSVPPRNLYCKSQEQAAKECMKKHNYSRDEYWIPCSPIFLDYRKCKAEWSRLYKQVKEGKEDAFDHFHGGDGDKTSRIPSSKPT